MNKLMHELTRLYLMPGSVTEESLARRQRGESGPVVLADARGSTRAIVIPFRAFAQDGEGRHWQLLCEVANVLQSEFGLPAPGVSVSGADGFHLWLSLATPVSCAAAREFVDLLRTARFADPALPAPVLDTGVELPPCRDAVTGRWAAFINPGMGASFVEQAGLEVAPPAAAQAGFLEGLDSIDSAQFQHVLDTLRASAKPAPPAPVAACAPAGAASGPGLLLRDATLEDIVRHLHAKGIEPTFRHVLPGR